MQPATPITAGLKIARWAAALHRCRLRLAEARERALCIQLGGAVGTLDALGGKRASVRNGVAMRLHLGEARAVARPARRAHASDGRARDRHGDRRQDRARRLPALAGRGRRDARVAAGEGCGRLERHAPQAQPRRLPSGAGRRRPRARARWRPSCPARSASTSARSAAGRPSWSPIPELVDAAGGALDAIERIAAGLVVNAERMKANLEALRGLVFSERLARLIARETDRASALALVDDWSGVAVQERRHLKHVALAARPSLAGQIDDRLLARGDRRRAGARPRRNAVGRRRRKSLTALSPAQYVP